LKEHAIPNLATRTCIGNKRLSGWFKPFVRSAQPPQTAIPKAMKRLD
jgi:hypothetical protein